MKRVALTDNSGRWFDSEKAECFQEDSYHNGYNFISRATGSQWDHESIYLTRGGIFVLNHWSDFQGSRETYEEISKTDAAVWFTKQEFADEDIPAVFHNEVYGFEIL